MRGLRLHSGHANCFQQRYDLIAINYVDCFDVGATLPYAVCDFLEVQSIVQHSFHVEGAYASAALLDRAAASIGVKPAPSKPMLDLRERLETSYLYSIRNGMLQAYSHRPEIRMVRVELSQILSLESARHLCGELVGWVCLM